MRMNREELRQKLVDSIDNLLSSTLVRLRTTEEQRKMLRCQRRLWDTNDQALDALLVIWNATEGQEQAS